MSLGCEFTETIFATDFNKFALVNMFLGYTPPNVKAEIVRQYIDVNAPLCIFFAISSFGMGVDCSGVQQKVEIVRQYSDVNAPLCIIFAISSYGMGSDCSSIQQVIHAGETRIKYSRKRESKS